VSDTGPLTPLHDELSASAPSAPEERGRRDSGGFRRLDPANPLDVLARLARSGDSDATHELLRRIAPKLLGLARSLFGPSHPDLDDVLQEMLLAVARAVDAFEGRCSFQHYALRIGVRIGLAERRRRIAELERISVAPEADELAGEPATDTPVSKQRKLAVRELVDTLPEEQAETITLRICLGMSLQEVAEATGAPVNTVRSRLRIARTSLRRRVEKNRVYSDLLETKR